VSPERADVHDDYSGRAETYLRLLGEAALRPDAQDRGALVTRAANVLTEAGVLSEARAAWILLDLSTALRARGRPELPSADLGFRRLGGLLMPGSPATPEDWRVIPGPDPAAGAHVMALVLASDRVLAPATLRVPPSAGIPDLQVPPWADMTAADDVGTEYRLTFANGSWAGSTWTGTIMCYPAPPPEAQTLKILIPNGPELLSSLRPPPAGTVTRAEVSVRPVTENPGERMLTRHAEAVLAVLPAGGVTFSGPRQITFPEIAATLEAAGALSALSPVAHQVVALYQLLGLPADFRTHIPPRGAAAAGNWHRTDEVPARWLRVVTHYGRRRHLPPASGTAAIGVALPELGGTRFAIAGLRSGTTGSFLHVVARGLRPGSRGLPAGARGPGSGPPPSGLASALPPGLPSPTRPRFGNDAGFSWWVRDDAGGWHLGAVEEASPAGGDVVLRLALLPPLDHPTATLTIEVTGVSRQVTATVPVHW
jgi:hypothetical protein